MMKFAEHHMESLFGRLIPQIDPVVLLRAIEQNPASIAITDPEGAIIYVNPRFCEVTGYDFNEVLGQNPRVLKGNDGYTDYQEMWKILNSGNQWRGEFHNRRKNGEFFWELALISPILDSQGQITHYLAIKEDITERKQVEADLEQTAARATQMATSLEIKNAKITAQRQKLDQAYGELKAAQAQMLQREKMASIGQLAAGVAHEINNPIGFVGSNLRTLDKYIGRLGDYLQRLEVAAQQSPAWSELTAERRRLKVDFLLEDSTDLIAESLEGSERVRKIVQNLKTFSRIDQAEAQPTDLNECLDNSISMVWNEIKYKAELTRDYGELPDLVCNPQELGQVFTNLLLNAAQAIDKDGQIRLVSTCDGRQILLQFEDNGSGIANEHLEKIFEPFFTTKPVGQGTGLGMSISYEIIKKHGGDIRVCSTPGEGTCFTLSFPLDQAAV